MRTARSGFGLAVFVVALTSGVRAEDASPTLAGDVLPLLKTRCVKCHGPVTRKAGLSLATPQSVARGGKNGASVEPGRPDDSLLWERVEADEMPPKEPLAAVEKAVLRRWIEAGAPGLPRVDPGTSEGADHWAFAPANRPPLPSPRDPAGRVRNAVDRFVLDRLERVGLAFALEPDRAALARRLTFDLTGLPPTPDEVAAFEADRAADAYERLVDRLLASPRFGERWGKFWLDAAGYADSNGYFNADTDRPFAWRYRDYVARATNADMPFDQFVREQLAGDELSGFRPGNSVAPSVVDQLVATHFLRNGQDGTGESDGNSDELRADRYSVIEGAVQVVGSALLGLTLQCARCHDHKFEPVTQRDYYALQAVLRPAFPVDSAGSWLKPNARIVAAPSAEEKSRWEAESARLAAEVAARRAEWKAWTESHREPGVEQAAKKAALDRAVGVRKDHEEARPGQVAWVNDYAPKSIDTHLLVRGDYGSPGAVVAPSGPAVLSDPDNPFAAVPPFEGSASTGRRLALARWLTRPGSRPAALLARVTVNRVWQYHFGAGLAASPENLGYTGAPPSHSELLDHLAAVLADDGWSLKRLHRLIVTSAAYRQSGAAADESRSAKLDPDGRLFSRFPLRRLDAEAVRDATLAVCGTLDARPFGPYVPSRRQPDGEVVIDESSAGSHRRALYLQSRRTQIVSFLDVFDAPSVVTTCPKRATSTIPLQSLSLLNSDFASARAREFASRLALEAGSDDGSRLTLAFLLTTSRPPDAAEAEAARRFLASQPARYPGLPAVEARSRSWVDFCQMMLASNGFLYVE